ncbi:MAG: MotA/TolQ/ExbB proton channel family protein, partial [Oscillospiraceae bacterium]|nr:MotA/TolQ/ExbB proton channel family protein [Oscillospiraceae bacterium]
MDLLRVIIHEAGQIFLIPCIIILLLFILIALSQVGSLLIEYFMERRHLKANVPQLIHNMHGKSAGGLHGVIVAGGLLPRQKKALFTLLDSKLPETEQTALARSLLSIEEKHYEKATLITDLIAKLGPMIGLLGTLIPLGPGIMALGEGDTAILSQSLSIAFDTTIAGLLAAAVCYTISRIRSRWYDTYLQMTETLMECLLEEMKTP